MKTEWLEFAAVVLVIAFANLVRSATPTVLAYIEPAEKPSGPVCEEIILPAPEKSDSGFLKKAAMPYTKPASPFGGFEAEFYWVTGYAIGDGHTPREITADGRKVRPGITVACPPDLPLGTAVYIEGFGVRICEDRGSAIVGKRLDIAFPSPESAIIFGKQRLAVAVIR